MTRVFCTVPARVDDGVGGVGAAEEQPEFVDAVVGDVQADENQ
ncbi:hypothetical protein [Lentzea indica]|nr:hypothetical protein [Lentzea indica]